MITYIIHKIEDDTIVGKIVKHSDGKYTSECLVDDNDGDYPVLLFGFNKELPRDDSEHIKYWLEERVVPKTRQGLDMILASVGMDHWDLEKLLELNHGRCSMDWYYLEIINEDIQG
jgi:hypothetical protein